MPFVDFSIFPWLLYAHYYKFLLEVPKLFTVLTSQISVFSTSHFGKTHFFWLSVNKMQQFPLIYYSCGLKWNYNMYSFKMKGQKKIVLENIDFGVTVQYYIIGTQFFSYLFFFNFQLQSC